MTERPRPRQSEAQRGKLPNLRINQAKVIGESKVRSNKPAPRFEGDCACALI